MSEKRMSSNESPNEIKTMNDGLPSASTELSQKRIKTDEENGSSGDLDNGKLDFLKIDEDVTHNFPPSFMKFLHDNQVNPDVYKLAGTLPRFIRTKKSDTISIETLEKELKTPVQPISWLNNFYKLSGEVKIAGSSLYKDGRIYGIDVSSGAAVEALHVEEGDHCLDLCCAPGAKLCMLAERAGENGTVTGVDISKERISSCRTVITKYGHLNVRLFNCDGTTFSECPPIETSSGNAEACFFVPSGWNPSPSSGLYDKVLVDAECTHDGSLKHITKYNKWGWDTFEKRFLDPERIDNITKLQKKLLHQGYSLLKPGGALVYSTCSFSRLQNEDVVLDLLLKQKDSRLLEVEIENLPLGASIRIPSEKEFDVNDKTATTKTTTESNGVKDISSSAARTTRDSTLLEDVVKKVVRFDPVISGTSGLFIARITKLSQNEIQKKLD